MRVVHNITLFSCMVVFLSACSIDTSLHYLTLIGRNLQNRKKLMLERIMSSAGVNGVGISMIIVLYIIHKSQNEL